MFLLDRVSEGKVMSVEKRLNQGITITNLNKYLDFNKLPVRMNTGGICKGLACVHAKYVLEGREEEYFRFLKEVAAMQDGSKHDAEVDRFVIEVVVSFMPEVFDKTKAQRNSIEALQINLKSLKSAFDFGMVAPDFKWVSVLQSIKLQTDEVMLVDFVGHAVNVRSIGGGEYTIYDPNYSTGFKIVKGEEGVVGELNKIARTIGVNAKNLGMAIQVVRPPDMPRKFTDRALLYEKHLVPGAKQEAADGDVIDNLYFAIANDDEVAFNCLVKKAQKKGVSFTNNLQTSASRAISTNSIKVLQAILALPESEPQIKPVTLINMALRTGRKEAFDMLLSNTKYRDIFHKELMNTKYAGIYINHAAAGGNAELLKLVIDKYKSIGLVKEEISETRVRVKRKPLTSMQVAEKIFEKERTPDDAIEIAIKEGGKSGLSNIEVVQYLFEQVNLGGHELKAGQMVDYLLLAIQSNKHSMVDCLISNIKTMPQSSQKQIFQSIDMNVNAVEKTEVTILRALKSCGVTFSGAAEGVLQQKENMPVSILTSFFRAIATAVSKWIDSDNAIFINIDKFKELKNSMEEIKAASVKPESAVYLPQSETDPTPATRSNTMQ